MRTKIDIYVFTCIFFILQKKICVPWYMRWIYIKMGENEVNFKMKEHWFLVIVGKDDD